MIGSTNALAQNKDWIYTGWSTNLSAFPEMIGISGYAEYVRTGHKRGLLSFRMWIPSNSYNTTFTVTALSILGTILGISFKNPSRTVHVGLWDAYAHIDWQYGNYVEIQGSGVIQLGRIYTTTGDFGDWPLSTLGGHNIHCWNIPVEEN